MSIEVEDVKNDMWNFFNGGKVTLLGQVLASTNMVLEDVQNFEELNCIKDEVKDEPLEIYDEVSSTQITDVKVEDSDAEYLHLPEESPKLNDVQSRPKKKKLCQYKVNEEPLDFPVEKITPKENPLSHSEMLGKRRIKSTNYLEKMYNDIKNSQYPIIKLKKLDSCNLKLNSDCFLDEAKQSTSKALTGRFKSKQSTLKHLTGKFKAKQSSPKTLTLTSRFNPDYQIDHNHLINCQPLKLTLSKNRYFKCPKCEYKSLHLYSTKQHIELKHFKLIKCPECDFLARSKEVFNIHMLGHIENRRYTCFNCQYAANNRSSFWLHVLSHDIPKLVHYSKKKFCIPYLKGRIFDRSCNTRSHNKNFSQNIIYKCSLCQDVFDCYKDCKIHELGHLNLKLYNCSTCGYSTNVCSNLKRHLLDHVELGRKRFNCSACEYQTNDRSHFKRHSIAHPRRRKERN